jgi:hypothetical protein
MSYKIIVARYNENIDWLNTEIENCIIYNKGEKLNIHNEIMLENVGRESHTYIYHIVNNYDNLADKTLFFQGDISDHKILDIEDYFKNENFIGKFNNITIKDLSKNIEHYGKYKKDYMSGNMKRCSFTPLDWIKNVIGININEVETNRSNVVWGANFSLSKELILSKPKEFYQNILRYIDYHQNLEEGHYLERTWYIIFNSPYIKKTKIYYLFFNNYEKINNLKQILHSKYNNEIHLWMPILANYEYGIQNKISFIKSNNKYILINPSIVINNLNESYFYIDIKGINNVCILIEFENKNMEEDTIKYEIILGSKNITSNNDNKIIQLIDKTLLDKNNFIRYNFNISNKIIVKKDLELLFDIDNISNNTNIKNIKIKSLYDNVYLDYIMNSELSYNNIKMYLCNNIYDNIKLFYTDNYYENYVEKIDLLSLVSNNNTC